jgi:hypothetical protein
MAPFAIALGKLKSIHLGVAARSLLRNHDNDRVVNSMFSDETDPVPARQ